jgi:hypothetical protein
MAEKPNNINKTAKISEYFGKKTERSKKQESKIQIVNLNLSPSNKFNRLKVSFIDALEY